MNLFLMGLIFSCMFHYMPCVFGVLRQFWLMGILPFWWKIVMMIVEVLCELKWEGLLCWVGEFVLWGRVHTYVALDRSRHWHMWLNSIMLFFSNYYQCWHVNVVSVFALVFHRDIYCFECVWMCLIFLSFVEVKV